MVVLIRVVVVGLGLLLLYMAAPAIAQFIGVPVLFVEIGLLVVFFVLMGALRFMPK